MSSVHPSVFPCAPFVRTHHLSNTFRVHLQILCKCSPELKDELITFWSSKVRVTVTSRLSHCYVYDTTGIPFTRAQTSTWIWALLVWMMIMSTRLWPQIKSHGSIKVSVTGVSNMHAPLWPISSDFVWHWQINKDVNRGRYWSFVISIVSNSLQSEIVKLFSLQTKNKKRFWYLYFHTYYLHHSPHPSLDAF